MPVIIHDLEIDIKEREPELEREDPTDRPKKQSTITPLDLREILRRDQQRDFRIRAH